MQDDIVPAPDKEPTPSDLPEETTPTSKYVSPDPIEPTPSVGPMNDSPASSGLSFETEATQPLDTNPVSSPPVSPVVPVKSLKKKRMIIGVIIVAVLAVLGSGGAVAYNLWFQNPDKVLGDALVNAVRAKTISYTGSLNYTAKASTSSFSPSQMKITVDGKNTNVDGEVNVNMAMTYSGKEFKLSGSGIYDKDANLYFKINDIRKTLDSVLGSSAIEMPEVINNIITKVDGKWIKVSVEDTEEFNKEYSQTQTCLKDTLKKFEDDKDATNEIINLYSKNRFIVVKEKLGSKNGSLGYVIEGDTDKSKAFVEGFNDTKVMKELQKCDESFKLDADDIKSNSTDETNGRVEVWVDRWSHQFTKFNLTDKSDEGDTTLVFEPKFNQSVSVNVPKDSISLSELKSDIEKAQQEYIDSLSAGGNTLSSSSLSEV